MPPDPRIAVFESQRRRLAGLAYRMTGSVVDSEDILQQAWLRFATQDPATIQTPSRWLGTVVARLCLDHLRSARHRRETYIGAWLPEPLVADNASDAERGWILAEDVSIALILVLETLSPEMRAAFILRDAFDYDWDEIALVVDRSPETCRQLVSRARKRLAGADPAPPVSLETARPLAEAFWHASRTGDMQGLLQIFTADIEVHSDGGGKVPSIFNVLKGPRRATGFFAGLARKRPDPPKPCPPLIRINGVPGFLSVEQGNVLQTTALGIRDGRIAAIWVVRNPDKLRHLIRH